MGHPHANYGNIIKYPSLRYGDNKQSVANTHKYVRHHQFEGFSFHCRQKYISVPFRLGLQNALIRNIIMMTYEQLDFEAIIQRQQLLTWT